MQRMIRIAAIALALGTLVPMPAVARCVRDVSESGAVGVRCSDGVRGRLATDDVAPRSPTVSTRSSSALGTRGGSSALSGGPTAASALSSSASAQRGPYGGGRPGDQSGGLYSSSRGADTAGATADRRPY
jgi:hypothetical protein